jgi:hypothetical protein
MRDTSVNLTANQVFGVKKAYELINYIEREGIDDIFLNSLVNGKHVSLYGASKTGKSSLIERHIGNAERLYVQCSPNWGYADFIDGLLNAAYGRTQQTIETIEDRQSTTSTGFGVRAKTAGWSARLERDFTKNTRQVVRNVDSRTYNLVNHGDLVRLFEDLGFGRSKDYSDNLFIIVDDFHKLSDDAQTSISNLAKMVFDNANVVLICVGIWAEEQKLSSLCPELLGRCEEINCNVWSKDNLELVAENGSAMLNISFPEGFGSAVAKEACGSVFIVQEACAEACRQVGIDQASPTPMKIEATLNAINIVKNVANRTCNFTDFHNRIMHFSKSRNLEVLYVYKIIINQFASDRGVYTMNRIQSKIESEYPRFQFDPGFAINACLKLNAFLSSINMKSIIEVHKNLQGRFILTVIDGTFILWLRGRKAGLLDEIEERIIVHQRLARASRAN